MAIEIVDLPIKNGGSFHSYGAVYQRIPLVLIPYGRIFHEINHAAIKAYPHDYGNHHLYKAPGYSYGTLPKKKYIYLYRSWLFLPLKSSISTGLKIGYLQISMIQHDLSWFIIIFSIKIICWCYECVSCSHADKKNACWFHIPFYNWFLVLSF